MLPNGQEVKLNVQRFCYLVVADITLVMLIFGCQTQMCRKQLKFFTLVMQEMRKKASVCNVTDVSSWKHVNFKIYYAGRYGKCCGLTEYSENLLDRCYKHYVERKTEKICLYQLSPAPIKKATSLLKACIQNQKLEI